MIMRLHDALKKPERYDWFPDILRQLSPSDCMAYAKTSKTALAFVLTNESLWLFHSLSLRVRHDFHQSKDFNGFAKCDKEAFASEMMKLLNVPSSLVMFRIFRSHGHFILGWYRFLPGIRARSPVLKGGGLVCIQRCTSSDNGEDGDKIELQIIKANGQIAGDDISSPTDIYSLHHFLSFCPPPSYYFWHLPYPFF